MAEPMRGVQLAERVVAVGLACVLGDLVAHDVAELAEAERLADGFGRADSAAGAGNVSARHGAPGIGRRDGFRVVDGGDGGAERSEGFGVPCLQGGGEAVA